MIEKVACISIVGRTDSKHLQQIGLIVLLWRPPLSLLMQKKLQATDLVLGLTINVISISCTSSSLSSLSFPLASLESPSSFHSMRSHHYCNKTQHSSVFYTLFGWWYTKYCAVGFKTKPYSTKISKCCQN